MVELLPLMEGSFFFSVHKISNMKESPGCRDNKWHAQCITEVFFKSILHWPDYIFILSLWEHYFWHQCKQVRGAWSTLENSSHVIWFITEGTCCAIACFYYIPYFNSIKCFLSPWRQLIQYQQLTFIRKLNHSLSGV